MRRCATATLAIAVLAVVATSAGPLRAQDRLLVVSQQGATLSEIDPERGEVVATVALDAAPAGLAVQTATRRAFVTHPDLGQISVVDIDQRRVERKLTVPGAPFGIAVTTKGLVFVADWNGNHVSVLDQNGAGDRRSVEVGRAPALLTLSHDEAALFVANRESDSVSVVHTSDLKVVATIAVGRAPFASALSPDGQRLYVGNVQGASVSVIDTARLIGLEALASGAMPYGAAVTPDGTHVLVTNQHSGTVSMLGGTRPPKTIRVGGFPEGIAVGRGGTRAYVANWFSDDVSVLDLAAASEVRRIKCPSGPRSIAVLSSSVPRRERVP